jgi:hypothetical protein
MKNQDNRLRGVANTAATYEVNGFLAHDIHDYEGTKLNFFKSLQLILPKFPETKLNRIAQEKTDVLRHHDKIEESNLTRQQKLESSLWSQVMKHARKEAELLGIDDSYAFHKVEFYRLHGQGITKFRDHVFEMEKYFTQGITGNSELYRITAPIYLTCIAFHDRRRILGSQKHDAFSVRMMIFNYANYVFNLLHAMNGSFNKNQ